MPIMAGDFRLDLTGCGLRARVVLGRPISARLGLRGSLENLPVAEIVRERTPSGWSPEVTMTLDPSWFLSFGDAFTDDDRQILLVGQAAADRVREQMRGLPTQVLDSILWRELHLSRSDGREVTLLASLFVPPPSGVVISVRENGDMPVLNQDIG